MNLTSRSRRTPETRHTSSMAYDEVLAQRLQDALDEEPGLTGRKMFGGWGFMVDGHIAVAASSTGDLMARVDPEEAPRLLELPDVRAVEMGGRVMKGWLLVSRESLEDDAELAGWVERSVAFARSLPAKG